MRQIINVYVHGATNFGSDIGMGIIVAFIFSKIFHLEFSYTYVLISSLFILLPDIDMLIEIPLRILGKTKQNSIHQVYTHYPVLYLPVGVIILFSNPVLGLMFFADIILHFLHDSFGTGWGVAWLWPFKKFYYKFFANEEGSFSTNIIQSWTPAERKIAIEKFDDDNWMENLYLNSWDLENITKTSKSGPSVEWLSGDYKKKRWFHLFEIILTFVGLTIFLVFVAV